MGSKDGDGRTVVVPESFFEALGIRLLRVFGPNGAQSLLYEIGREAGRAYARDASQGRALRISTDSGICSLVGEFDKFGWAQIRFLSLDIPNKFAVVEWRDGVGVPKGSSPVPVCHLGRGLLAGAAEVAFSASCDAIETKCQAMGADHCEIVVGIPERVTSLAEGAE